MSNPTTDFDDAGPALPELDALARHAAAQLRATTAGFDLVAPTRPRAPRLLSVAAVVLLALLVAAVVVVRRDHDDRQRTVTGPGAYLFPSYVPQGLRFTGAYEAADGPATDPGVSISSLSRAVVYATDDDARAVVAFTITDPSGPALDDEAAPGQHLEVGGLPATWQEEGGLGIVGVQVGPGRTATYFGRGLTRSDLVAVAASAAEHGAVPPAALPGLPPGLTSLGTVTAPTVLHGLTMFSQLDSGVQRALGWQAKGRTLSIVQLPGDERSLRIGRLLTSDVTKVEVGGHDGWATDIGGVYGVSTRSKMVEVTWLDGDRQVVVDGVGLSRADVLRVARSVRSLTSDAYRAKVEALGGTLGAPDSGAVVVAQGGPPVDVAAWRVTARVTADGEELCLQRRAGSGCSGQSSSISGTGQTPNREPVDMMQLDRSGPPVVLMGSIASDVATLKVAGKVVRPGGAFGTDGRRAFAVALPSATTSVAILATDRSGGELFRRTVSFEDQAGATTGSGAPSTTVLLGPSTTGPR